MEKPKIEKEAMMDGVRTAYFAVTKLIANETRWKILSRLTEQRRLTWSDMQFVLKINPNMIRHHVNKLLGAKLIEKANPGFKLTNAGKAVMTMSIKDMQQMAEIAIEIATTENE